MSVVHFGISCKRFFLLVSLKLDSFKEKCISERFWNISIGNPSGKNSNPPMSNFIRRLNSGISKSLHNLHNQNQSFWNRVSETAIWGCCANYPVMHPNTWNLEKIREFNWPIFTRQQMSQILIGMEWHSIHETNLCQSQVFVCF